MAAPDVGTATAARTLGLTGELYLGMTHLDVRRGRVVLPPFFASALDDPTADDGCRVLAPLLAAAAVGPADGRLALDALHQVRS